MAKKASKKPAETTAKKTIRTALPSKAKKAARTAVKPPAKKAATKRVKGAKAASEAPAKQAAKVAKAPVAKKAGTSRTAAVKTLPKAVAKPALEPVATAKATGEKMVAATAVAAESARAPAFQLPRDGGTTVYLSDYAGQKLVIFFYPRASTPGCTKEAIDFTRLSADFQAAGTAVLGVSADSLKAQESFRDKFALGVPLLSDATQTMLKSYGAWGEKSMYGKIFEGVLRTTVLIDAKGNVAKIWRSVKVDGHADAVLEEARRI